MLFLSLALHVIFLQYTTMFWSRRKPVNQDIQVNLVIFKQHIKHVASLITYFDDLALLHKEFRGVLFKKYASLSSDNLAVIC